MGIRSQVTGALVDIDPVDRGMEALVDEAGRIEGVAARAAVAATEVKVAIGTEVDIAAIMVGGRVRLGHQRLLTVRVDFKRLFLGNQEARYPLVEFSVNLKAIIDKDLSILIHVRVDRQTE